MAEEVVVNCGTGEVVVQADTFLAVKPAPPPPPPPPPNANAVLIDHLNSLTLTPGGEADVLRQGVITVLTAQPAVPAV